MRKEAEEKVMRMTQKKRHGGKKKDENACTKGIREGGGGSKHDGQKGGSLYWSSAWSVRHPWNSGTLLIRKAW